MGKKKTDISRLIFTETYRQEDQIFYFISFYLSFFIFLSVYFILFFTFLSLGILRKNRRQVMKASDCVGREKKKKR